MKESLLTSIEDLATTMDSSDVNRIISDAKIATEGTGDDKLKFICDNKQIIYLVINAAKIPMGPKIDKILDALKTVIESLCV